MRRSRPWGAWTCALSLCAWLAGCSTDGDPAGSDGSRRTLAIDGDAAGSAGASDAAGASGNAGAPVSAPAGSDAAQAPATPSTPVGPSASGILASGCATASVETSLVPSHLLFVLDRSGSMACNPPPTTDSSACEADPLRAKTDAPSKWEIVEDALLAALRGLPSDVGVGISYFSNDDACGVHPTPSVAVRSLDSAQLSAVEQSLGSVTPGGGTPLVGATILAYQHLHARSVAGELPGHKFVVLLTDGQQSEQCGDPTRCDAAGECTDLLTDTEAPKATQPGVDIRTFVIGAPGSEPARAMLSRLARAGGTAPEGCDADAGECHFDMTRQTDFAAALNDALAAITGRAATCVLPLPESDGDAALDRDFVNVVYTPGDGEAQVVPQDTRAACDAGADGWQYGDDGASIVLCGPICDTVRADAGSQVDVVIGCKVQGPE